MIREAIIAIVFLLIGYFMAGIWPVSNWVLEILRRGM